MNDPELPGMPSPTETQPAGAPTPQRAKRGRKPAVAAAKGAGSSHGATGGRNPLVLGAMLAAVMVAVWFPLVVASTMLLVTTLSGCELVYLPECDTDCTAAGGSDAYGRPQ